MGTFNDSLAVEERKKKALQTVTLPIVVDADDVAIVKGIVEAAPDSLEGEVTGVVASSGNAEIDLRYTAHGANVTDIKRRLAAANLAYSAKRPKTVKHEESDDS